jgi:pimeloyl-ACP methyl ester carboxylesterase
MRPFPKYEASFYGDVPADQRAELFAFREEYLPEKIRVQGVNWPVIDTGDPGTGHTPLLILVGGLRVADAAFKTAAPLAEHTRVIVPTYPRLATMAALCDGLVGVLDALGVQKVHVLAGSFGGMIAQVFVRRHSQRVANLILSSTGIPDAGPYRRQRAALQMLPGFLAKRMLAARMLDVMAVSEEQHAFWEAFLQELFMLRLEKTDALVTFDAILDFAENHTLTAEDLNGWTGQLLIIQSSDDATFDAESRAAVEALYPGAQFHVFEGAGHSPAQNQPAAYQRVVRSFLGM